MPSPVQQSTYNLEDQARMSLARNYFAWQGRLVCRELGRRVLEVGCGIGNFTGMLLDREAVLAIDVEAACVERLLQRYPNQSNLRTAVCELASSDLLALRNFEADSCVCLNVLEHIEDDHQALDRMSSILVPRGVIILIVPALPALFGPIDRNLGHYRRYTRFSLASVVHEVGLRIRKMHYMNIAGMVGWWANARVFKREVQSEFQIKLFDRCVAPVMSRLEERIPPPIGQSLFAVLERP